MKSLFKPKTNNISSDITTGNKGASSSTATTATETDLSLLYPTTSSSSSASVIVHPNPNTNTASTLQSQHCYIRHGQLKRSSSSSGNSTSDNKQTRPKVPTRTSSFLTRLKSTAKKIRSNDSSTTAATGVSTSSSWCKSSSSQKTLQVEPTEGSSNELQVPPQQPQEPDRPTLLGATEATFDLDETSSTVSSTPSSILSNIRTSSDAFISSAKTPQNTHNSNYTTDGTYSFGADYDDEDDDDVEEMESIVSFDSMIGSNEIELEDEDITSMTPMNYNYMYENEEQVDESSSQYGYALDYGVQEQDYFLNERELERRELRLELLKNFS